MSRGVFLGILLMFVLSLAALEGGARLLGFKPHGVKKRPAGIPVISEPDSVTGYRNKAGVYRFSHLPDNQYPIKMTVMPDGSRSSPGLESVPIGDRIVFLGGSIGFGWGVTDEQVLSNIIARDTAYESLNLAVPGHGSYQALLFLRRWSQFWSEEHKPAAVVYLAISHHALRNVLDPAWARQADSFNISNHYMGIPYVRRKEGVIEELRYLRKPFPLREHSAFIATLESIYMDYRYAISLSEAQQINVEVIRMMHEICEELGIRFIVAHIFNIPSGDQGFYIDELGKAGIESFDCNYADYAGNEAANVPNDGHPSGLVHEYFAQCLIEKAGLK